MALRLLVIDDHALFTDGLRPILLRLADSVEVSIAHDLATAEQILERGPDRASTRCSRCWPKACRTRSLPIAWG